VIVNQTRKQRLFRKLWAPDTIGVLLICLYITQFLIYPEAVDYVTMTLNKEGYGLSNMSYTGWRDESCPCYADAQCRVVLGVVEVGIGTLKAALVFALFFAVARFLHRTTRKAFLLKVYIPLVASFGIYFIHLGMITFLIIRYPFGFERLLSGAVIFYRIALVIAAIVAALLFVALMMGVYDRVTSRGR